MQQHDLALLLIELSGGGQWKTLAACGSADPDLFFPVSAAGCTNQAQVAEAKAVCARCLVRRQCLDFAIHTRQMHGIWGGTTEEERYAAIRPGLRGVVLTG